MAQQTVAEDHTLHAKLCEIASQLPPVRFAIGYGSGVVKQRFSFGQPPMKDFIFAVDDSKSWHTQNLERNRRHYSGLAAFGGGFVSMVQENFGAGVYYNTHVEIIGENVKYGVISVRDLLNDLQNWTSLYVAGRMHKPVRVVAHDPEISLANETNLRSALAASLLMLPATFKEIDLWRTVTGLSYLGDFRMGVGENPNKIRNIVTEENMASFEALYRNTVKDTEHILQKKSGGGIEQDLSEKATAELVLRLPPTLRTSLSSTTFADRSASSALAKRLRLGISSIVRRSSTSQAVKGIFTAGVIKSAVYAYEKFTKMKKGTTQTQ